MKTIIAALAFLSLAVGPVFAATPTAWQLHEGRASVYIPFSGGYSVGTDPRREGLLHP